MSTFDADALMGATYTETNATSFKPVPEGDYKAIIDKITPRQFTSKEKKVYTVLDISWNILDDRLKAIMERDTIRVQQTVFLEIDEDDNSIQFGDDTNVQLGRLRQALGQNDGSAWSIGKMVGEMALVRVTQRAREIEGQADPEITSQVSRVSALPAAA